MKRRYNPTQEASPDLMRNRIVDSFQRERDQGYDNRAVDGGIQTLVHDCIFLVVPKMRGITKKVIHRYATLGIDDRKRALQILMKVIGREQIRGDEAHWIHQVSSQQDSGRRTLSHPVSNPKNSVVSEKIDLPSEIGALLSMEWQLGCNDGILAGGMQAFVARYKSVLPEEIVRVLEGYASFDVQKRRKRIIFVVSSLGIPLLRKRRQYSKDTSLAQNKKGTRTNHYTGRGNRSV